MQDARRRALTVGDLGRQGVRFFLNATPCAFDVALLRVGLAYAEAQRRAVVQAGVRQVEIAAVIETVHDLLVGLVSRFMAKAD